VIVVFGSINLDLVASIARLPRPGETLAGTRFSVHPGGKGANQALAARRAGAQVALAGAVGNDAFAAMALAELAAAAVDLTHVGRMDSPTGVALIHVDAAGENSITVIAGANGYADGASVPDALLTPGTTVLMQLEVPLPGVLQLAKRAREQGARVILNAAPWRSLPLTLLESLDVLIVNEIEAADIAASPNFPPAPESAAVAFYRQFGCATAVTLGADGAVAAAEGALIRARAPKIHVIDTTGAGDAFAGVLAATLDRGQSWTRAVACGIAAGSLACTAAGAQEALPARDAIDRLASTVESELVSRSLD
jgi:ribokinase